MDSDGTLRPVTTMGSSWIDGLAWPEMQLVEAPGPGGPIETWIASPAGAGDAALPTIVDVHGGPLGAWSPAPSLEVVLLCARGYRVVLPNIRGSASYGRRLDPAPARRLGRASTPTTSTPRSTTSSGSGSRTRSASASSG